MKNNRHTFFGAVHLFLIKKGKVLLSRRSNTGYEDGKYSVPAGHIEQGETAFQAMVRETLEEIGIVTREEDLAMKLIMQRLISDTVEDRIDFFFEVTRWHGEVRNLEPAKCSQLEWVDLNKIEIYQKELIPYVFAALKEIRFNKICHFVSFLDRQNEPLIK